MSDSNVRRAPRRAWSPEEDAILREHLIRAGLDACAVLLPDRKPSAIKQRAHKLGLSVPLTGPRAMSLRGGEVLEAARLRADGWSYARIGVAMGRSEATISNALLKAECRRAGNTPARHGPSGAIIARDIKRLHAMMMAGMRGTEIQLQLGISASNISYHRKKLHKELKAQRKGKTLPPPGNGAAYSGRKFTAADRREVERLFLEGLGATKIAERVDMSPTQIGRVRNKLVERLARKGECLTGCDINGRRLKQSVSARFIQPAEVDALRLLLLNRTPVKRAAALVGMGTSSAYRIRDALAAEMQARGESLPPPLLVGKDPAGLRAARAAPWMPPGQTYRYRALCLEMSPDAAKAQVLSEAAAKRRADAARPLSFEEKLERVRNGARIAPVMTFRPVMPDRTLGGVATGAL